MTTPTEPTAAQLQAFLEAFALEDARHSRRAYVDATRRGCPPERLVDIALKLLDSGKPLPPALRARINVLLQDLLPHDARAVLPAPQKCARGQCQ